MMKSSFQPIPAGVERVGKQVIDAAMEVHRHLGPGFLERIYEDALCYELQGRGMLVERQKEIVVPYKDLKIQGQRLDLLVGSVVIVELKTVDTISPVHQAQLLSYLKATRLRLGFIINFKVKRLKDGIKRMVL